MFIYFFCWIRSHFRRVFVVFSNLFSNMLLNSSVSYEEFNSLSPYTLKANSYKLAVKSCSRMSIRIYEGSLDDVMCTVLSYNADAKVAAY